MANTNELKMIVEPELIHFFCEKNELTQLDIKRVQVKQIFNEMEPDLIAYSARHKTLYVGEVTTSGYLGQKRGDFHVGAVKKVFEAFSKFYLFFDDFENIVKRITRYIPAIEIDNLKCVFIVPQGSKFINALGYRKKLFEKGYMTLETIELSSATRELMIRVLNESKNENMK